MSSANGHYDQALLAEAQAPTKAQRQEGYNADILQPNRTTGRNDTDPGSVRTRTPASKEHLPVPVTEPRRPPFWRTRKGIIIIVVAALVVIGAVVGGAVGGTVGKNNNDDSGDVAPGPTVTGADSQPIAPPSSTASAPAQSTNASGGTISGGESGGGGGGGNP